MAAYAIVQLILHVQGFVPLNEGILQGWFDFARVLHAVGVILCVLILAAAASWIPEKFMRLLAVACSVLGFLLGGAGMCIAIDGGLSIPVRDENLYEIMDFVLVIIEGVILIPMMCIYMYLASCLEIWYGDYQWMSTKESNPAASIGAASPAGNA